MIARITDGLSCSDCRTVLFVEISALGHRTSISVTLKDHFINVATIWGAATKIEIRGLRFVLLAVVVDWIRVERTIGNFLLFLHCNVVAVFLN